MKNRLLVLLPLALGLRLSAQTPAATPSATATPAPTAAGSAADSVALPEVMVYSPYVANQAPAATFAMPVSALRYEPLVDVQARNLAEAQADVTIRGGIFENTGFKIGGSTLVDPQTGHYFSDIPVAPAMLGAPEILTGVANATGATNATTGTVAYGWRPIRTGGAVSAALGDDATSREELYVGQKSDAMIFGQTLAADAEVAHSRSDGSVPFGDSHFDRVNARLQLAGQTSQTDFFAGYQASFFGWPNLYTPFNFDETENLETTLFAFNHRVDFGNDNTLQFSVYHRRNKDDYAFDRTAPLGTIHPYQHTTWVTGGALDGRTNLESFEVVWRAEMLHDKVRSTTLIFGPYNTRTLSKFSVVPEKTFGHTTIRAGATLDHSDRNGESLSPVVEVVQQDGALRWHASYARVTQVPTYTALKSSPTGGLFRGNQGLGREASHQAEAGVNTTAAGWTLEAAVFWRRDDALVDWTFAQGVTARTANPMNLDTEGAEFVARRSFGAYDLVLGYTLLTKSPDYLGAPVNASFYALNYARDRVTAALTARLGGGFELRMDNVARIQAANTLRTAGGDSAVISTLALAYRPREWHGLELSVEVENLWNSSFQEVPSVPAARREFAVGASYVW